MKRYLADQIKKDLNKKMVFVAGPRQIGKTFLAKQIIIEKEIDNLPVHPEGYLNWDIALDREHILKQSLPPTTTWVFDEIHKYHKWRNYLKGIYDQYLNSHKILVTGSAKLDYYRRGGESLQGRYFHLRLHPLSVAELKIQKQKDLHDLLELGGFPEPFLSGSKNEAKRWSSQYRMLITEEEISSLEQVQDIGSLELLYLRIPELVGSPLSINSIREDLQVSFQTTARWLQILERVYAIFLVPPFESPKIRAIKKANKHYHFDWSIVPAPGAKFENFVACHLLKWIHYQHDTAGRELELRYFRDTDGREVDFVILEDRKPIIFIECKTTDHQISKHLVYLTNKYPKVEAYQLLLDEKYDYVGINNIRVMPAIRYLQQLV